MKKFLMKVIKVLGHTVLTLALIVVSFGIFPKTTQAAQVVIDGAISDLDATGHNASPQLVWISDTEGFAFYVDTEATLTTSDDVMMASTTDSGATWGNLTTVDSVNTTDVIKVSVWYDRWTPGDTTGNLIHIVTLDVGVDDTYYTQYNVVTNQFSTTVLTVTEAATSMTATNNTASITKARDGALYITSAEAGDSWAHRCTTTCTSSANWSAITSPYSAVGDDHPILLPLVGTDNVMLLWWDISTDDIESNIYSATSSSWWGNNTGINQNEPDEPTYGPAMMGATVNRSTGEIYLAYIADNGNEYTVQDHDIDIWEFNNATFAWAQKTASALVNVAGGLTGVKIAVDENTGDLYLAYLRRTTIGTVGTTNVYWRKSTDNGETWGAEQGPLNSAADDIRMGSPNLMSDERIGAMWKFVGTVVDQDGLYHETIANLSPVATPTVTTNAATGVTVSSATLNGEITATGGSNATVRGFAWGTNSTLSSASATTTESGSFGIGTFSQGVSGLLAGVTYYFRAYATNPNGTGYGSILNFTAGTNTTPSRKLRLFEGFTIKFISGKIILHQQ